MKGRSKEINSENSGNDGGSYGHEETAKLGLATPGRTSESRKSIPQALPGLFGKASEKPPCTYQNHQNKQIFCLNRNQKDSYLPGRIGYNDPNQHRALISLDGNIYGGSFLKELETSRFRTEPKNLSRLPLHEACGIRLWKVLKRFELIF
jgi:hypothetical protein